MHKIPVHQDAHTVQMLAESYADVGHEVSIFLMEDGVLNVVINHSPRGLSAGYDPLLAKGVRIALCTYTTEIRGLSRDQFLKGVEFQSQYDLSKLVNGCDRFLSFL